MNKKNNDPFGFNKAINYDKLKDPKVLKELENIFEDEEEKESYSDIFGYVCCGVQAHSKTKLGNAF